MKRFFLLVILIIAFVAELPAQEPADTTPRDTVSPARVLVDTLLADTIAPEKARIPISYDSTLRASIKQVRFFQTTIRLLPGSNAMEYKPLPARADVPLPVLRKVSGKEYLFYAMVLLFILFAVLRRAFPKYFSDLFRLFFRTTLKQRQLRDQLTQTPLPSLLFNAFFVLSGGLYITFLLQHFAIDPLNNFWATLLYACIGLAACYFVKYAGLKICGWLFSMDEAADSYVFIVFIVNKMVGILLLPLLLILAFSLGEVYAAGLGFSWCLLGGLLIYRFILTYGAVRNQVKLNMFHFFLYIAAFEIAPLLLVYKALLIFFNQTT
ncbi:MAG: DUF4271 domain-containing protein [Bacteroidetes bacterium]|nr:DUF4271 domain-containing protein [Bacteroidota bacterium]